MLGDVFANLSVPVTIIASEDDPIVTIDDIHGLRESRYLDISLQAYGGHCGFLDFSPYYCWYEREIEQIFRQSEEAV